MKNKIIAVVRFNNGEAFVLKNKIKWEYTQIDNETIIGTDGVFYKFYKYERPYGSFQAFAGEEFTLKLKTGEIINCEGQWWDAMSDSAVNYCFKNDIKIIFVTAGYKDELKKCYVFFGCKGDRNATDKLRKKYKGKIYEYREYEKLLKEERAWEVKR